MSKITLLTQKTFDGKPSGFAVTLDDGRFGNLQEKESDKGLKVGDDVIVTEIPYTSKKGVKSTLLGLKLNQHPQQIETQGATPPQRPAIHVGAGKSANELKADASISVLLKILDAFYAGKLGSAQISVELKEYDRLAWSEIDEVFSGK